MVLDAFLEDPRLDPVHYVKAYIRRTERIRTNDGLFILLRKPHTKASTSTIARWISQVIEQSGQEGTGGSVRSASTSLALNRGASLETVMTAGDWSRVSTFKKFYYKPVSLSLLDKLK